MMLVPLAVILLLQQAEPSPQYKRPGVRGFTGDRPLTYSPPLGQLAALSVHTGKESYEAGEPVTIRLVARNVSDQAFHCYCTLKHASIDIEYRLVDGPYRMMKLTEKPQYIEFLPLYRLEPGEAVSETTWAAYDYGKAAPPFDRAGRYEIRVTYYDGENRTLAGRIVSDPIEVEVVAPTEGEAYQAYRGDLARLAQRHGGGPATDAIIRQAADFLERFGTSLYAPDVRSALAGMLRWRVYKESGMLRDDATEEHRRLYERYRVKPKNLN